MSPTSYYFIVECEDCGYDCVGNECKVKNCVIQDRGLDYWTTHEDYREELETGDTYFISAGNHGNSIQSLMYYKYLRSSHVHWTGNFILAR